MWGDRNRYWEGVHRTSGLAVFSAIDKVAPKPGVSYLTGGGPTVVSL